MDKPTHVRRAAALVALAVLASGSGAAPDKHGTALVAAPATPADSSGVVFRLPLAPGTARKVIQGNGGAFSHTGLNLHAWDFAMPEGSPVHAAAGGTVVRVKQDSDRGGTAPVDKSAGNAVVIDHGGGLFTQYLHLRKAGARVAEGDMVTAGRMVAESGDTGFSSAPHLHFQVQDALGRSLPARFSDAPGDGVPKAGEHVTAPGSRSGADGGVETPAARLAAAPASTMPGDAFAANGIAVLGSDLFGNRLSTRRPLTVRGRVTTGDARRVAIYLMRDRGGDAVRFAMAPVATDRTFTAVLDLADLPAASPGWSASPAQSNGFALAIAPVAADGRYWSDVSMPLTVH